MTSNKKISSSSFGASRIFRIGDKVISLDKLGNELVEILRLREEGATQEEAAQAAGVTRSFVSNIETLGGLRKGAQIAIFAFPVSNGAQLEALASEWGIDLVLAFSETELTQTEQASSAMVFNQMLETIAEVSSFDALILAASDYRIETFKKILNINVIGIELGRSPITEDVELDLEQLSEILSNLIGESRAGKSTSRVSSLVRRWTSLRR